MTGYFDHGYLPTYLNVLFWLAKPSAVLCFDRIGFLSRQSAEKSTGS